MNVSDLRPTRDLCEEHTSHLRTENPNRMPVKASVCVIWDRSTRIRGVNIRHVHLCATHANALAVEAHLGKDNWTEQSLDVCGGNL